MNKYKFESQSDEYSTPDTISNPLIEEFGLDLDVCANENNKKCKYYFSKDDNGLNQQWDRNFWCNPPYSQKQISKWVKYGYEQHLKYGVTGVFILPVRSNTNWWHKYIIDTKAEVRFLKGEIKFNNLPRGLWNPYCIVIFNKKI